MNKAFIIGRLTKDPDLRQTGSGTSVCTLSVAVNRRFDKKTTDYFNVVAWKNTAETCAQYLVKGQQIAVVGEIQNRSYEDSNGNKRTVTEVRADEIEFLAKPEGRGYSESRSEKDVFEDEFGAPIGDDENLPF